MSDDEIYITWEGYDCPDWIDANSPPEGVECKPGNGVWRERDSPRDPLIDFAHYRIPESMAPGRCKFAGAGWYRLVGGKCVPLDNDRVCPEGSGLIDCWGGEFEWDWEPDGTIDSAIPANKEPIENWYLAEKLDGPPPELLDGLKHKHPPEYRLPKKGELYTLAPYGGFITALSDHYLTNHWIVKKVEEPEKVTPVAPPTPVFEPVVDADSTEHFVGYMAVSGPGLLSNNNIDCLVVTPTAEQLGEKFMKVCNAYDPEKVQRVKIYHDKEPVETPELQLEVGKTYRRADGEVRKIEREDERDVWPFIDHKGCTYTANGQWVRVPGVCDLIEEVPNGSPATKIITLKRWLIKHGNQWHLSLWQENPPRHTGMEPIEYGKTKTVEVPA